MQPGASGSSSTMSQSSSTMSQSGGMQGQFMTKMESNHIMASDLIGTKVVDREGRHDEVPEQAFYMQGGIDDVIERSEQMKKAAA